MTEIKTDGLSLERVSQLRAAIEAARKLKIEDPGTRRDVVVNARKYYANRNGKDSVLTQEQADTFPSVSPESVVDLGSQEQETLKHKYFETTVGDINMPVVMEADHCIRPTPAEIYRFIKSGSLTDTTVEQVEEIVAKIKNKLPLSTDLERLVETLHKKVEFGTKEIAEDAARGCGAASIVAKRSIIYADANNSAWFLGGGDDVEWKGQVVVMRSNQFSTGIRGSRYLNYRSVFEHQTALDHNGKLKKPQLAISIHGMKDRKDFGFAIAGGVESASPEVLEWFKTTLGQKLQEEGIQEKVIIDREKGFRGLPSLKDLRVEPIKEERRQYPSFGDINMIQLEIGATNRKKDRREKVVNALINLAKEYKSKYGKEDNE